MIVVLLTSGITPPGMALRYVLTRERLHHADIFLSPRTQLGSLLRHLCSLVSSRISGHRKIKSPA
jgi:hypothetical protein